MGDCDVFRYNFLQTKAAGVVLGLAFFTGVVGAQPAIAGLSEDPITCAAATEPIPIAYDDHTINCSINPFGDVDQFKIMGSAGDEIRILVQGTTNRYDPRIELRDPDFNILIDNFCTGGLGICTLSEEVTLPITGMYILAISDLDSNEIGSYTLQIEKLSPLSALPNLRYDFSRSDSITPPTNHDVS